MSDTQMERLKAHVAACPTCIAANGRVNDFCDEGRLMFYAWANVNPPTRIESVQVTDEQYARLQREQKRQDAGKN